MKTAFFLVCFLLFSLSLEANTTTKRVTGFGLSEQKAVTAALLEAISQVKGVKLSSKEVMYSEFSDASSSHNGVHDSLSSASDEAVSSVSKATQGLIKSYNVVSIDKSDRGYEALVDVKISVYKAPGLSTKTRRKIAVMPFYISKPSYMVGNKSYSGQKISDLFSQALTSHITQSRRFAVVDRSYLRDMQNELSMISSKQTPIDQQVKLGQKLSADYLLVGTIQEAGIQTTQTHNQLVGSSASKSTAEFIIDYRIIVVGSSQIKFSDTTRARIDLSGEQGSIDMTLSTTIDTLAQSISNKIHSSIYPIRVIDIDNSGVIVLNQGGNSITTGAKMDVMRLGKKMIDPYTKESLGRVETKVATLEITKVTPKLSYAKVVNGSSSLIKKNDICRREKSSLTQAPRAQADDPSWKQSSVEIKDDGGVKLPFD